MISLLLRLSPNLSYCENDTHQDEFTKVTEQWNSPWKKLVGFKLFPKRCKNKWDQVLIQSKASISILLRSKAVHISAYFALKTPFLWRHNCFWIVNRNVSLLGLHCVHCSHVLSGKSERIPFVLLINHLQCRRGIHSLNITNTNPEQQVKTGSSNCNCLFSHFNILYVICLKRKILLLLLNCPFAGSLIQLFQTSSTFENPRMAVASTCEDKRIPQCSCLFEAT